ncbi:MAG TPA: hypothetical protein VGQ38_01480 [Gaiellaceae bacterium]|jgi:preprotein translocase subunit SecG|nr:hypothetical protein [Gaiellaceae bacterium]
MKRTTALLAALVLAGAIGLGTAHTTPSNGVQHVAMLCPPAC